MGQDSPVPIKIHMKIRRRLDVKSLMNPEEGEFKFSFDRGINSFAKFKVIFKSVTQVRDGNAIL